jgi:antirestriction protein ArdC
MSKYHDLVSRFIAELERGTRPWARSWALNNGGRFVRPLRANGLPYRGMNVLALWCAAEERGFDLPHWMTFNQAKELGANVRKGARAAHVFYYGTVERENDKGETTLGKFVKTYCVFNVAEIEGLPAQYQPMPAAPSAPELRIAAAEDFTRASGAIVRHGGNRAFYSPAADFIQMPTFGQFESPQAYYATLFHELTHWTGSHGRSERPKGQRFGDPAYALEELVAELGAAFLCSDLHISDSPREDHASYLAHWAAALKAQPSILMSAASAAERACDYLHARHQAQPVAAIAAE